MIEVKANQDFDDMYSGARYHRGDLLVFEDVERVRNMCKRNIASIVHIVPKEKKVGKKIIVYQNLLYHIGGIETADYQLAKAFRDRDICFVFRSGDVDQMLRIGKYCEVMIDDGVRNYGCDVLILANYDSYGFIKGRVRSRKIYQQCHADWLNMKRMVQWKDFEWYPDEDIDRVISVSETTSKALQRAFEREIKSIIVPNILVNDEESEFRMFLSLSRFTAEKGGDLVMEMIQRFHEKRKNFLWVICGDISDSRMKIKLRNDKSIVLLEGSIFNEGLIRNCDILVQLSKNESYCYSVHQALSMGKPCLCTDIPEFRKLIKNEENGWLVGQHLENLDVDSIFGKRLEFEPIKEEISPLWDKLLEGKL